MNGGEKKTAIFLVGLPGVGKSTFYNKNKESLQLPIRISSDDYIDEYALDMNKTYDEVFEEYIGTATKRFFDRINTMIAVDESFCVDRTFINEKSRAKVLKMIPDDYEKIAIEFLLPDNGRRDAWYDDLEYRSEVEGKTIPQDVLNNMLNNYESPSKDEGYDQILQVPHYSEVDDV